MVILRYVNSCEHHWSLLKPESTSIPKIVHGQYVCKS